MLTGKRALVTGSTSGIGLAIARALAGAGAEVVLNGRRASEQTASLCLEMSAATGSMVTFQAADVSRAEAAEALVQAAGPVDILVNNAGIQHVAPIESFAAAAWDAVLATNLSAAFHVSRAAIPAMRQRRWGRLINIASVHGLVASPFKAAYVAAKHGMIGLTKVIALETATDGITCNAICPGYVFTPLVENQIADQAAAHGLSREQVISEVMLAPQPTRRFIDAGEVAALAVFLCGDAARSITGAALPVDGGWTAR
jgi:3-hydroxybutyrate dehydrogenase